MNNALADALNAAVEARKTARERLDALEAQHPNMWDTDAYPDFIAALQAEPTPEQVAYIDACDELYAAEEALRAARAAYIADERERAADFAHYDYTCDVRGYW